MVTIQSICQRCQMPQREDCSHVPGVPMVGSAACPQFDLHFQRVRFSGRWPVPSKYSGATLEDRPKNTTAAILGALNEAYDEAESALSAETAGNIIISGSHNGIGKTHLAAALINRAKDHLAMRTAWTGAHALIERIKSAYDESSEEAPEDIVRDLIRAELVCIDDVGKQRSNEHADGCLWAIFDGRYLEGRPTIVTSNLSGSELSKNDTWSAIVDRLMETATIVKMGGNNPESIRRDMFRQRQERADAHRDPQDPIDRMGY